MNVDWTHSAKRHQAQTAVVFPERLRMAPPTIPKPAMNIAQVAGSGTAATNESVPE